MDSGHEVNMAMSDTKVLKIVREKYAEWLRGKARAPFSQLPAYAKDARSSIRSLEELFDSVFWAIGSSATLAATSYRFADFFPPEDPASVAVLSMLAAINDFKSSGRVFADAAHWSEHPGRLRLSHGHMRYAFRMAVMHLTEARDVLSLPAINDFFKKHTSLDDRPLTAF